MKDDIYAQSNSDIIRELGTRFKDYRKRMGLTQKEVAAHTGLSVFTISTFENGTFTGLTLSSFLKYSRHW
nr:helix-turn-helix transcriptional regulator [uncultured Bacteroides sp.]